MHSKTNNGIAYRIRCFNKLKTERGGERGRGGEREREKQLKTDKEPFVAAIPPDAG